MTIEVTQEMPVSASTPRPVELPRAFGRYTLLYQLARGGMGDVFLAVVGDMRGFERVCVVKTVRAEYASQTSFVDRFLDEGRLLTQLSHGHIAQTIDVGRVSGSNGEQFYVALEYVEGKDLAKLMDRLNDRGRNMPLPVALHVAIAVLNALDYAHRRADRDGKPLGLIHRDISPQNVLVSYEGDVKLIDFGNARTEVRRHATAAGIIFGKPGYIAPEQSRGSKPDPRSDLYAVGVTLWEALAGKRLLEGDLDVFLPKLRDGKVRPEPLAKMRADVPPELDRILSKAMAPDREQRYPDAATMRADLQGVLATVSPRTGPSDVATVMREVFEKEISVERRLISQLLERAPSTATEPMTTQESGAALAGAPAAGTRYRLLTKLGEGAMGEVFAAEHVELGKVVALKILHRAFSQNQSFVERFRREARAVARLGHPAIVQVSDFGETADGRVFFAMEKLEGESLETRLDRDTVLPETLALRIAEEVCGALGAAHGDGIVHRDLKPDNVWLCSDGTIKLLDFGVAKTLGLGEGEKLTRAGEIFGTPEYMAPEQASNREVDARTDLYAVGVILYEMVTGSLPFQAASAVDLLHAQIHASPEPPRRRAPSRHVNRATERLILVALAKDPDKRFATAERMAAELHAAGALAESVPRKRALGMYVTAGILSLGAMTALAWSLWAGGPTAETPGVAATLAPSSVVLPSHAPVAQAAPEPPPPPPRPARDTAARSTKAPAVVAAPVVVEPAPQAAKAPGPGRGDLHERIQRARELLDAGDRRACDEYRSLRQALPGSLDIGRSYARALDRCGRPTEARTERARLRGLFPDAPGLE